MSHDRERSRSSLRTDDQFFCLFVQYNTLHSTEYKITCSVCLCVFLTGSGAYGNNRALLAQSTKFGTQILWAKGKLFGGVPDFQGQGQTSLIATSCRFQNNFQHI